MQLEGVMEPADFTMGHVLAQFAVNQQAYKAKQAAAKPKVLELIDEMLAAIDAPDPWMVWFAKKDELYTTCHEGNLDGYNARINIELQCYRACKAPAYAPYAKMEVMQGLKKLKYTIEEI